MLGLKLNHFRNTTCNITITTITKFLGKWFDVFWVGTLFISKLTLPVSVTSSAISANCSLVYSLVCSTGVVLCFRTFFLGASGPASVSLPDIDDSCWYMAEIYKAMPPCQRPWNYRARFFNSYLEAIHINWNFASMSFDHWCWLLIWDTLGRSNIIICNL